MLESSALHVEFGGVAALSDVTFGVDPGSVVGLIGPNGAGKSTFLAAATGAVHPRAGAVTWNGERISDRPAHEVARAGVARTFQHAHLFSGLTVLDNVAIGAHRLGESGALSAMLRGRRWRRDEAMLRRAALDALAAVHATQLADRAAENLTAGQQRLVAVARALAAGPSLLLLDEPAAGLTDAERDLLASDLASYVAEHEVTVVVVEHNLGFLMSLASRLVVFDRGRVLAVGDPASVRADPAVIAAYLGVEHAAG